MAEPYVTVDLDGVERKLRFDLQARYDFEKRHGRSMLAVLVDWAGTVSGTTNAPAVDRINVSYSYVTLARMLWAGLKWHNRALTEEGALQLIQRYEERGNDASALWTVLFEAARVSGVLPREMLEAAETEGGSGGVDAEANPQMEAEAQASPTSASATG